MHSTYTHTVESQSQRANFDDANSTSRIVELESEIDAAFLHLHLVDGVAAPNPGDGLIALL
jgi:hypothetical protein